LKLTGRDSILFLVSDEDATKIGILKKIDAEIVMKIYCEKLRKNLNAVLSSISYHEHLKEISKNSNGS
jgi:hypothetical protein